MKYLLAAMMLLMSAQAWSCGCFGISSIRETIATHPNLVEAQAVSVSANEATLRVTRVLKGTVSSSTVRVGQWMCYASLYPELMKPQHTYVLPLRAPALGKGPLEVSRAGEAIATVDGPKEGEYEMPGCAESGFELVGDKLYTFEPTTGAHRRLQVYGAYSHFLRWRPVSEVLTMSWLGLFRYPDLSTDQPSHDLGWQCVPPIIGLAVFFCFAAIHIRRVPVARVFAVVTHS